MQWAWIERTTPDQETKVAIRDCWIISLFPLSLCRGKHGRGRYLLFTDVIYIYTSICIYIYIYIFFFKYDNDNVQGHEQR